VSCSLALLARASATTKKGHQVDRNASKNVPMRECTRCEDALAACREVDRRPKTTQQPCNGALLPRGAFVGVAVAAPTLLHINGADPQKVWQVSHGLDRG
jgi:hypothetical protein